MDVWRVKLLRFRGIVGLCFFAITLSSIATCNILFRTKKIWVEQSISNTTIRLDIDRLVCSHHPTWVAGVFAPLHTN